MRLALYQPDIPQNAGTILRLAACLGVAVDVIGPNAFPTPAAPRPNTSAAVPPPTSQLLVAPRREKLFSISRIPIVHMSPVFRYGESYKAVA